MEKPPYSRSVANIVQFGGFIVGVFGVIAGLYTIASTPEAHLVLQSSVVESLRTYNQILGIAEIIGSVFLGLVFYLIGGMGLALLDVWEHQEIEIDVADEQALDS